MSNTIGRQAMEALTTTSAVDGTFLTVKYAEPGASTTEIYGNTPAYVVINLLP
jgi:hypothetical protein